MAKPERLQATSAWPFDIALPLITDMEDRCWRHRQLGHHLMPEQRLIFGHCQPVAAKQRANKRGQPHPFQRTTDRRFIGVTRIAGQTDLDPSR